jgi:COG4 transport protein
MESTVFIAVSADASSVDDATDPATAYAQSLSNVFNSTYTILQQYLSMVIQGMENSLGDVHFIRKLHARCEQESGLVLKRYMKFRKIKDTVVSMQVPGGKTQPPPTAEVHAIQDELALLIQYCCMYSKYLKQLCLGAESRSRHTDSLDKIVVFPGNSTNFDKMVDELINRYYMEGEKWLMKRGIQTAFEVKSEAEISGLDECFFVLQRCGHRAVATNNIHGACAVLHMVSDLLLSDVLKQVTTLLNSAILKISSAVQEQTTKHLKSQGDTSSDASGTAASISSVLKGATSLANQITGGASSQSEDDNTLSGFNEDPFGLASFIDVFNTVEICSKYTERLRRDVSQAGDTVFGNAIDGQSKSIQSGSLGASSGRNEEIDKMKLCQEDFESVKIAFAQVLRTGSEQLVSQLQQSVKEVISFTLGRHGLLGGIKLELDDEQFDMQPAVAMLPKSLVTPIETMVDICTTNMSEHNKDTIVGLLANTCCEKIEQFIYQVFPLDFSYSLLLFH